MLGPERLPLPFGGTWYHQELEGPEVRDGGWREGVALVLSQMLIPAVQVLYVLGKQAAQLQLKLMQLDSARPQPLCHPPVFSKHQFASSTGRYRTWSLLCGAYSLFLF